MLFNPTQEKITRDITLPLYYTGLTDKASVSIMGSTQSTMQLNRNYEIKFL